MNPISCLEAESLFNDYLDGILAGADRKGDRQMLDAHLATCTACGELVEDMRLAMRSLETAGEMELPPTLITRIIEQTSGQTPAGVSGWRHRMRGWWDRVMSPIVRPVMEPRFALGMAMSIISFSMLLHLAGVDLSKIKASDLEPSNVVYSVRRGAHLATSKVSKSFYDLRVVYEIQTQLQQLREERSETQAGTSAPKVAPAPAPEQKKEQPRNNKSKDGTTDKNSQKLNRSWTRPLTVAAFLL